MPKFPCHVFKSPGPHYGPNGKTYSYAGAADQAQFDALMAKGWKDSLQVACGMVAEPEPVIAAVPDDNVAPTRAELEQKATEMGLRFDGRTTDAKLARMIAGEV